MKQFIIILVICALFTGCGGKKTQEEVKFSLPASAEALLDASLADLFRQHGERYVYFSNEWGFFCWVDEENLSVFFHVPKLPYETLDIESLPIVYDPEEGYDYYDFNAGNYTPDDFLVSSVIIRRGNLSKMFGGKDPVTLDMINEVFDEPDRIIIEYDQGMVSGSSAGPFIFEDKMISFSLYNDDTVIAASVWLNR